MIIRTVPFLQRLPEARDMFVAEYLRKLRMIEGWRARMQRMTARRESFCPQCRALIEPGDTIVRPYQRNREGGNVFAPFWYCVSCAEGFQLHHELNVFGVHLKTKSVEAAP